MLAELHQINMKTQQRFTIGWGNKKELEATKSRLEKKYPSKNFIYRIEKVK